LKPKKSPFAAWAGFVYRRRAGVLALALAVLTGSVAVILAGGALSLSLQTSGPAQQAATLVRQQIPQPGASSFQVVFQNSSESATSPGFRAEVEEALRPLRSDRRVTSIITPYDKGAAASDVLPVGLRIRIW
jgi:hypothetical protein